MLESAAKEDPKNLKSTEHGAHTIKVKGSGKWVLYSSLAMYLWGFMSPNGELGFG